MDENRRKCFKCGCSPAEHNVKLFRFPKPGVRNLIRCLLWAKYIFPEGQYNSLQNQAKLYNGHRMLCDKHFKDTDFKDNTKAQLLRTAVPCDVIEVSQLMLEKFDCEGEPASVGARWERWKRELLIYLDASGIDKSEKKRASLLHFGGLELQEIFNNIPDTNVSISGTVESDIFKTAINKLDAYFTPKQSKVYERYLFRLIKQESNEKFEHFLVRLRQQADKCQFTDKNDQIIDQVTEKCSLQGLRKKILQKGDSMTLDKIIAEANALEAVSRQMEDFGDGTRKNIEINKLDLKIKTRPYKPGCGRCGSKNHGSQDTRCPAWDKDCLKSGLKGHFRQYCRIRLPMKRKSEMNNNTENEKTKSQKVLEEPKQ